MVLKLAFSGKMSSGKSTFINKLIEKNPNKTIKIINITDIVRLILDKSYNMTEKEDNLDVFIWVYSFIRDNIDSNMIIKHTINKINEYSGYDIIVIEDLKFLNEVDLLKTIGFKLVRLDAGYNTRLARIARFSDKPNYDKIFNHMNSKYETDLDSYGSFDYVLNGENDPETEIDLIPVP